MRHHQIANPRCLILCLSALIAVLAFSQPGRGDDLRQTDQYRRLKSSLDAVPAIDTHDHLPPSDKMSGLVETPRGRGMTLFSLWSRSYFPGVHRVEPWPASGKFDDWWRVQQPNFVNARATSFYRYLLPAFQDLYGVDFDTITPEQAAKLNDQIFDNYRKKDWLEEVVTRRANIELMLVDPFWARLQFARSYRFTVPLLNVTTLMSASHPDRYQGFDSPYVYAAQHQLKTATFDDFLAVVDAIFADAVAHDCVCLKSTQAYSRTLNYENVPKERAAAVYGKSPKEATPQQQKDFEDFMFWHVCQLSAKYDLPFQVHTGQARIQGSNPMLLVDVIEANRATKFILFHGGYPWVGETAVIGMKERNVWIDSVWLPTLSQTVARRAYQEWLDAMPSDRIMWGADCLNAEGIYGSTVLTRQCLADALAEKVQRGELNEADAMRIGRQILRDNALQLFPKLKRVLWRKDVEAKVGMGASRATRVPGATPQFSPKPKPKSGAMPQAPAAKPPANVTLRGSIVDADTGRPLAARLYIQGAKGTWHHARSVAKEGSAVEYNKAYGPDSVEIHTSLSAGEFAADLPPGRYTLTAERGKEYLPGTASVDLGPDAAPVVIRLKRFIDMSRLGWYSGDTHVHRPLAEVPTLMLAEDLNITLPITYWITQAGKPPKLAAGQTEPIEAKPVVIDPAHIYYPLNTEYEIFDVAGKPHMLGAFFALHQTEPLKLAVPPVEDVAREVRRQGGLLELDKHNWPWSMMLIPTIHVDLYELTNNHVWRTGFRFRTWAEPPPDYMCVERDLKGGVTENGWIDFTLQNYYCLLDCGFRMRPTAGTGTGVHPVPLGYGRVYVHCDGDLTMDHWLRGLDAGQSFVTTGPLMDVRVNGELPGKTFTQEKPEGTFHLTGKLYSQQPLARIEVVMAGEEVRSIAVKQPPTPGPDGGFLVTLDEQIPLTGSTWLALRCFEPTGGGRNRFGHTAPWHVDVPGHPLRPRHVEIDYLVGRMESEIKRHTGVLPEAALAEYRKALAIYQEIARTAR